MKNLTADEPCSDVHKGAGDYFHGMQDKGLGTFAVFMTAISTILGAILFLRFGFAVAHVGLLWTMAIIVLGHLVTIPTALAVAEIATKHVYLRLLEHLYNPNSFQIVH